MIGIEFHEKPRNFFLLVGFVVPTSNGFISS